MTDSSSDLDFAAHSNDAFFKSVFSEPHHAIAFFKSHLPSAIVAGVDWQSLEVVPTSFVKSSLQQVHSDLVFSVDFKGRRTLLYLVFEHQSTVDPTMPLRLLGYVLELLQRHHQTHGLPLPPVLPFVFHQGPEPWQVSTAFEDLFDLPAELAESLLPFVPKFRHALLDLTKFDPAGQEHDMELRMILQLMKLARERELLRFFEWLAGFMMIQIPDRLLGRMLLYALHADSNLDTETIHRSLKANPELKRKAMSVAEKLKAEGRQEGRQEGLQEGHWIGKIELLDEFLGNASRAPGSLELLTVEQLQALYAELLREYETRFKGK